jgi:L-2,4-diaminobutyrate decarboxylase
VTAMYDLTKEFAEIIKNSNDFDMAVEPDSNIICFRYIKNKNGDLNILQKNIRNKILENEKFYIVQTMIKDKQYLRCTIINPLTKLSDLRELLDLIRSFDL